MIIETALGILVMGASLTRTMVPVVSVGSGEGKVHGCIIRAIIWDCDWHLQCISEALYISWCISIHTFVEILYIHSS